MTFYQPGIHDMPDEEYFALEAANNSGLKDMTRSPAHFQHRKKNPKPESPQMKAGKCLHTAILEPEKFLDRYAILPPSAPLPPTEKMRANPKPTPEIYERIDFWDNWELLNANKEIIKGENAGEYLEIGNLIRNHPELALFFESGKAEQVILANDPQTGVLCKCKPDHMTRVSGSNIVIELKSTDDCRPDAFTRTAYNFGYFQASAFYQDVMSWSIGAPDLYLIVAFEREAPYGIKIYEVAEDDVERGRRQYRSALDLYAYCLETNEWPLYNTTIELLEMPYWAKERKA